jgi:ParB family chromosome partitioning protein
MYKEIPIGQIEPNPSNARKHFDESKIKELALSIRATGLQQFPCVQEDKSRPGVYILESGERRFRALKMLGAREVPCIVTTRESLSEGEIAGLAENVQRENLTPYELSLKLEEIKRVHKLSSPTIGKMLGLSSSYVGRLIGLQELLADDVKKLWREGNPRATVDFLHGLTKVPKAKQIEAFQETDEDGESEEKTSTPREKKRNCRKIAEQLQAAMLKMSAEDRAAIKGFECVGYILGARKRPPAGISLSENTEE